MARFEAAPINLLHVLLALVATAAIVVGSVTLLPEEFIDYGIMAGVLVWTTYLLVSQWGATPLRRAFYVAIAIAFLIWMGFVLWPFDSPM